MSRLVNHRPGTTIGRHSLSQPIRADSSLREGAGERSHSTGYSLKSGVGGRFSSPLRNSKDFTFHHSSGDTPSVSRSLDSSLREGAGEGLYHSTGYSLKSWVSGDFHRPYETQMFLHFTIQCTARKTEGCGRFSLHRRGLRSFYIPPFGGGGNNLLGRLVKIFEKYLTNGQMCASIAPSIFESGLRRQ